MSETDWRRVRLALLGIVCAAVVGFVLLRMSQTAAPEFHPGAQPSAHAPGVPEWIPAPAGARPAVDVSNHFPDRDSGSFHFAQRMGIEKTAAFYRGALPRSGLVVTGDVAGQVNEAAGRIVTATGRGGKRRVMVAVGASEVNVSFEDRK